MQEIKLKNYPSQEFDVTLDGQKCKIKLYQRSTCMYIDVYKDNIPVAMGVMCLCDELIPIPLENKFKGALGFVDTQQTSEAPYWEDLETRYVLLYCKENDEDLL